MSFWCRSVSVHERARVLLCRRESLSLSGRPQTTRGRGRARARARGGARARARAVSSSLSRPKFLSHTCVTWLCVVGSIYTTPRRTVRTHTTLQVFMGPVQLQVCVCVRCDRHIFTLRAVGTQEDSCHRLCLGHGSEGRLRLLLLLRRRRRWRRRRRREARDVGRRLQLDQQPLQGLVAHVELNIIVTHLLLQHRLRQKWGGTGEWKVGRENGRCLMV